ncbi:MAG TPA: nucleotide sugar dehydrogenase [Bryobacteraceae bacterium]|nr:nucleotide sugar dehydrogenase [Bryobacteraceae bacterium]
MPPPKKIAVVGLGYVGCVSAACFSRLGHQVIGVDRDEYKVRSVNEGIAPFFEPGLEELIAAGRQAGRLSATTSLDEALAQSDIALLCVGTPSEKNGNLGLDQLRRVTAEIAAHVPGRNGQPLIVAVRSTVFPGTCDEVLGSVLGEMPGVAIVSNPEFLREGTAVKDFLEPSIIVVGGHDRSAVEEAAGIYSGLPGETCLVSLRTAEMIKYACNAFHALKISFANEIGTLSASLGVSPAEVMDTVCRDTHLNISPAYLKPGFAFGGSCLPKDLRALSFRASRLDLSLPVLEAVLPSNRSHLARALEAALSLPAPQLGIFGLAFKENTDDLRESPVVQLLEQLIGKGRQMRIHDPHIQLDRIYGSNQQYLLNAIPHIGRLMEPSLETLLEWADHIILAQKPSAEAKARIAASGIPVLDLSDLTAVARPVTPAASPTAS